jgi:phosphatidylglycerophosphate synthase
MGATPGSTASAERAQSRPGVDGAARLEARRRPTGVGTAILLANAAAGDGPAGALRFGGETLLARILGQLAALGIRRAHVITRPEWVETLRPSTLDAGVRAHLHVCADTPEALRAVAAIARSGEDGLVVTYGDIVTHGEALAGLLADPRTATAVLSSTRRAVGRPFAFRTRLVRGRVVTSESPYHAAHAPNASFLGVVKVAPGDREALADVADRLAALCTPPLPASWEQELAAKHDGWRLALARAALRQALQDEAHPDGALPEREPPELDPATLELATEDEAEAGRWLAAAPHDVAALVVVGLIRSGVHVGVSHLRKLYWARALSPAALEIAAEEITQYDEDRVLLDSAVKANDGFFTTHFVSPYSKYVARWAARRGISPNAVTTVSMAIGTLAALAFATGERAGLIIGAVLAQIAFTTDCVDGQLARYTRTFSRFGAWLDSVFDRTKEYVIFAGLAIGASRAGDGVWVLASAALALQTVRHAIDFSYPAAQHQILAVAPQAPLGEVDDGGAKSRIQAPQGEVVSEDGGFEEEEPARKPAPEQPQNLGRRALRLWRLLDRRPGVRWVKKMIAFPIGERFAVISLTAAVATARTTFIVLLCWGGFALCYTAAGRVLRSLYR